MGRAFPCYLRTTLLISSLRSRNVSATAEPKERAVCLVRSRTCGSLVADSSERKTASAAWRSCSSERLSSAVDVARREFKEELGQDPPGGDLLPVGSVRQAGGKVVHAWTARGDLDVDRIVSMKFTLEWPPRSGKTAEFPEVDRAGWFDLETA